MNILNVCSFVRISALLWFLLALFVGLEFCGCGGGSSPIGGDGTSGVRGVVTTTFGTPNNMPMSVANALVSIHEPPPSGQPGLGVGVFLGGGRLLAQTYTDTQGQYSFTIRPGSYVIVAAQNSSGSGATGVKEVTVQVHQFAQMDVPLTTGP